MLGVVVFGFQSASTMAQEVDDAIPVVVVPCQSCVSLNELKTTAVNYFRQWKNKTPTGFPTGTYVRACTELTYNSRTQEFDTVHRPTCTTALVVSVANPLSGPFNLREINIGTVVVQAVDLLDTLAALDFDNRVFGCAMKQLSITLPEDYSPADEDVILSGAISGELVLLPGTTSTSWWHFFTNLPSLELVSNEYTVVSTGQRVRIFVGATITVKFSNGYTAKFKLVNILSSIQWQFVPGSLRDQNGNEPNAAPDSAPTGDRRSDAAATVPDPMAQSNITFIAPYPDRRGFVSIEVIAGAGVGYPTTYIRVH